MEKVLRKISVKDRLPSEFRYYYTDFDEILFDSTKRWLDRAGRIIYPEYWYEEVSVDELVSYTDPVVVKRVIEIYNKLSKKRYEKALELLDTVLYNPNWYKIGKRALCIAAGIKEDKI